MSTVQPLPVANTRYRRNDYDVTDTVQVSLTSAVENAVRQLFAEQWPDGDFLPLEKSFGIFESLFSGQLPGYNGVDTIYHDQQHSLDVVLAMARLLVGYEKTTAQDQHFGFERASMGLVTALFHDAGYIRHQSDTLQNGAEYTRSHVTRSARFIATFLPTIGMADWVSIATRVVHFSGYEVPFAKIHLTDWRDRKIGHLLGTADFIAQMADRCYLEKCRDRLYPEFVLGGAALNRTVDGDVRLVYGSGLDLLRKTPEFVAYTMRERLDGEFGSAYRYMEALFEGKNPYISAIQQHLAFLRVILKTEDWPLLRRNPPCFTSDPNAMPGVRRLMLERLREAWQST
jgi:hypothetical protein